MFSFLKKKSRLAYTITAISFLTVIAITSLTLTQGDFYHNAELRFTENSMNRSLLGSMMPASCESSAVGVGAGLSGPGHSAACIWTPYCTGADPVYFWQTWRYSDDDTVDYENIGTCSGAPTATSHSCNAAGTVATLSWSGTPGYPTGYYPRLTVINGQSCPSGWTMWTDNTTCYINNHPSTSVSIAVNPGQSYSWWVHSGSATWISGQIYGANFSCYPPPTVNIYFGDGGAGAGSAGGGGGGGGAGGP